jgi:hypothetical protein
MMESDTERAGREAAETGQGMPPKPRGMLDTEERDTRSLPEMPPITDMPREPGRM